MRKIFLSCLVGIGLLSLVVAWQIPLVAGSPDNKLDSLDWQLPNEKLRLPFEKRIPIQFVNRTQNVQEWLQLNQFWNEMSEKAVNPLTGEKVTRKTVKIKVPLGLSQNPPVPSENEMFLERWVLGKKLYFDPVLSSDGSVSCASCHSPELGWTDQSAVSIGIGGQKGGVSAPPVFNSAYNLRQFWDGRAASLEDQAQGPPGNPIEMFDNQGHAWNKVVLRVRENPFYVEGFKKAYGTEPTRDTIAKAIALFERTVLKGNSIHDRADFAMRIRVTEEGGFKFELKPVDYEKVLKEAVDKKDTHALKALGLNKKNAMKKIPEVAQSLVNGHKLFFGKARCNSCHVGDNFTDNQFHNLGVGVKDGRLPPGGMGRYAALPLGHKDAEMVGAFKTPTLRGLVSTAPYMHDGSEKTLEEVVEFYDRGGNANRYLDAKMRDFEAEKAYILARQKGEKVPEDVAIFGPDQTPVVPLKLNLTDREKKDLVLFMQALEGDPVDSVVADTDSTTPLLSLWKK